MRPLSMKDKHIYIVIMVEKPRFITKIDYETKTAEWNLTETPVEFHSYDDAWRVCLGLMWRGTYAFPVITHCYEQKEPLYKEVEECEKDPATTTDSASN